MTMRSGLSQAQEQALMRPVPQTTPPPAVAPTTKEIPYDYVARFTLRGPRGNRVQDVINISVEGAFVAVAIGYSFIPAKLPALPAPPPPPPGPTILLTRPTNATVDWLLTNIIEPIVDPLALMQCLVVQLCGIDFKYSVVDSGTGRELQNQPIHNIAGLGEATGERPFRPLAKPMLFLPRSTIRIEVEEISEGPIYTGAELFIVLHGYKMLGYGTALP
jgi:hypothetical protein